MQMMMAAINAMKGGRKGFNNFINYNKGGVKGGGKEEKIQEAKCATTAMEIIWPETARNRRRRRGNATSAEKLATWPRIAASQYEESTSTMHDRHGVQRPQRGWGIGIHS